ncbi:hypothetical protein LOD99_3372 [Oopsacas minuta]|uniref:Uncharacterized protein n=1 Tax=Oopsacas minuta TaxID=111878 RepID=A0AAV7JZH2_9METZ|nr:hypothetical protein LOD99_3372 [Oopsacas minuta]
MTSLFLSKTKYYTQGLLVRHTSGSTAHRVSFYSLQQQLVISEWVTLVDIDNVRDLSDIEKMVLLDCNKLPLLNSLLYSPQIN